MSRRGESITGRLLCGRPGAVEAGDYQRLFGHPEIGEWLRPAPLDPFTVEAIDQMLGRDRAHWEEHQFGPWVLRECESGDFVGRAGLAWMEVEGESMIELLWAVMPEFQGRGYATEAAVAAVEMARDLELDRVVSLTLPANRVSLRVMEKAGLTFLDEIEHAGLPHALYELRLR